MLNYLHLVQMIQVIILGGELRVLLPMLEVMDIGLILEVLGLHKFDMIMIL